MASLILVSGLFFHRSRIVTFDGHIHISTIAQFTQALKDGEFPVTWSDGFGSYGLPLPFIAHQTTSYLGAVMTLITQDVVLSYTLLFASSAVASTWLFYLFIKRHVTTTPAIIASLLFTFAPYRIINIYIRGALPEFFAACPILIVLLGIGWFFKDRNKLGLLAIIAGVALLALTHPMMVVIGIFLFVPYFFYCVWPVHSLLEVIKQAVFLGIALTLGLSLAGYYVVPLLLEMKYLYQGLYPAPFLTDKFLNWESFFSPNWYYFYTHPGPRGHFIQVGLLETLITISGVVWLATHWRNAIELKKLAVLATFIFLTLLFFVLPPSLWFYQHIFFLTSLQFPWRMLSALIFVPPLFLGILLQKYRSSWLSLAIVLLLILLRFPQLYGKNFIAYSQDHYYFNIMNLHGQNMTPVWAGNAQEYPPKPQQADVIEGQGIITQKIIKNGSRSYTIVAQTPIRVVDYTFYFPGWKVRVDGQPTPIEFQDMNYRGVITYYVPAGQHQVKLTYESTKIRWAGRVLTMAGILSTILFFLIWQLPWTQRLLPINHKQVTRHHTK